MLRVSSLVMVFVAAFVAFFTAVLVVATPPLDLLEEKS